MISEATVRSVKYPPELIPDSWFGNVPLNAEFTPPVLDLKNFKPYVITLANIQVPANPAAANVVLRARYDGTRIEENTAAMLNILPGAWRLMAKNTLYLNFFGMAGTPYTTHYGLWVIKPTIAHKVLYGLSLSNDESALAEKLGIRDTVEKGLLPLPFRLQIEREYPVIEEETRSRMVNINAANTTFTIESIYPRTGEIVVLTRIAAQPGPGAANVVRLIIDRDEDAGYADVRTWPLSLVAGGEVECFIPALRELRLTATAAVFPGNHWFRYTLQRVKLNNILRARFGLATKEELPGDVFDKVISGVL